jgi:hypothetical protein
MTVELFKNGPAATTGSMQRTLATELIALEQQKKLQPVNVLS